MAKIVCLECRRTITAYKRNLCWRCHNALEVAGLLDQKYPSKVERILNLFDSGDCVREKWGRYPLWGMVVPFFKFNGMHYGMVDREPRIAVELSLTSEVMDMNPHMLVKVDRDEYVKRIMWIIDNYPSQEAEGEGGPTDCWQPEGFGYGSLLQGL